MFVIFVHAFRFLAMIDLIREMLYILIFIDYT